MEKHEHNVALKGIHGFCSCGWSTESEAEKLTRLALLESHHVFGRLLATDPLRVEHSEAYAEIKSAHEAVGRALDAGRRWFGD